MDIDDAVFITNRRKFSQALLKRLNVTPNSSIQLEKKNVIRIEINNGGGGGGIGGVGINGEYMPPTYAGNQYDIDMISTATMPSSNNTILDIDFIEVIQNRYFIYSVKKHIEHELTASGKLSGPMAWIHRIATMHMDSKCPDRFLEQLILMDLTCFDALTEEFYVCKVISEPAEKVEAAYKRINESESRFSSAYGHPLIRKPRNILPRCPKSSYVIIGKKTIADRNEEPAPMNTDDSSSDASSESSYGEELAHIAHFQPRVHTIFDTEEDDRIPFKLIDPTLSIDEDYSDTITVYDDLHYYIRMRNRIPEPEALGLFHQMCELVSLCHKNGIILRDIKLKRFYFIDRARMKLQYESLAGAIILDNPHNDLVHKKIGCPFYTAPELFTRHRWYSGKPADIWALGVALYTMLIGHYPFYETTNFNLVRVIRSSDLQIPPYVPRSAQVVICQLLRKNYENRLPIEGVLLTSWLKNQRPFYTQVKVSVLVTSDDEQEDEDSFDEDNPENKIYVNTDFHEFEDREGYFFTKASDFPGGRRRVFVNVHRPTL